MKNADCRPARAAQDKMKTEGKMQTADWSLVKYMFRVINYFPLSSTNCKQGYSG